MSTTETKLKTMATNFRKGKTNRRRWGFSATSIHCFHFASLSAIVVTFLGMNDFNWLVYGFMPPAIVNQMGLVSQSVDSLGTKTGTSTTATVTTGRTGVILCSQSNRPPQKKPRRTLKKRRGRGEETDDGFPWDTAESRPLVPSISKEYGEDYWIDELELEEERRKEEAMKNRTITEGEIPRQKLWDEILSPYKQNWIGLFTIFIVIMTALITKFPELLNQPIIPIPDL